MSGLPANWEWDYDGQRWFYKYKPTGHIQYHFPKEGDEFPDFIDAAAPAPVLAPEERLESQQQVKRQASTTTSTAGRTPGAGSGGSASGWKSRMSASARPVSTVWDDVAGEDALFQPESFMFLGPGAYNDVSPLAEEEEEAARRVVAGGIEERVEPAPSSKGVSPMASARTTPHVANSEVARASGQAEPSMSDFMMGDPTTGGLGLAQPGMGAVAIPPTVQEEPVYHELPVEEPFGQFDPVGIVAEMPTYDTAAARAETDPEPVEMADNMVLAPIETALPEGFAELPERTSPAEQKTKLEDKPLKSSAPREGRRETGGPREVVQPVKADRRPAEGAPAGYQAYKPGMAMAEVPRISAPEDARDKRRSQLQRETSLMMGVKPNQAASISHANVPAALAPPQVPPKQPLDEPAQPKVPSPPAKGGLSYVPSVLKPARNGTPQQAPVANLQPQPPAGLGPDAENGQGQEQPDGGISKFPSVLRPARRRAPSQPGQPAQQGQFQQGQPPPLGQGYVPPAHGQHPASMTPSPLKQLQKQQESEPRMGVQRVNTLPEQLPSQRPESMVQGGQPAIQDQQFPQRTQQPARPATVMPDMMMGGGQSSQFNHPPNAGRQGPGLPQPQDVNASYQARVQGMSSTVPPPQNSPFAAPQIQPLRRVGTQPQAGSPSDVRVGEMPPRQTTAPYPPDEPVLLRQNTAPYPPDQPVLVRQHTAPYPPDQPVLVRQNTAPYPTDEAVPEPSQYMRRHSSFANDISPLDSRSGSVSSGFPLQTPSPMEHSRRASSSASLSQTMNQPNYSPSPVSQSSGSQVFTPTPPSQQADPGSYFAPNNTGGQGHAVAAQNKLRKKSLGRADSAKRNSLPPGQSPLSSTGPPSHGQASLHRSQSLRQTSQDPAQQAPPQQQPQPQPVFPEQQSAPLYHGTTPPIGPQYLHRIEEREEVADSSTPSPGDTRRSSMASLLKQSPQSSRRQSLQGPEAGTENIAPQGWNGAERVVPQGQQQVPPQGHMVQGGVPPTGQMPVQALAPLKRKPSRGQAPPAGHVQPQGQLPQGRAPPQGQTAPQGQMTYQAQMAPQGQAPQGQVPSQGLMQPQNRFPQSQSQPQAPRPQGQTHVAGHVAPQNQTSLKRNPSKGQAPAGQIPQGQIPQGQGSLPPTVQRPTGQMPLQQGQMPPQQPQQGQMPLQGQRPPSGQMPSGQMLPQQGQMPPQQGQMPSRQGQIPPGQMLPQRGQIPPQGQRPHLQMPSQGQAPNGMMSPQVQIPQGQQPWNPNMQPSMAAGFRPGSVPLPAVDSPKEKKWLKWLKPGSKSVTQSPTTPQAQVLSPTSSNNPPPSWGGGEYSEPAVWQPGQPIRGQQPSFPTNMPPLQHQQHGQLPHGPGQVPMAGPPQNHGPASVPLGWATPPSQPMSHPPSNTLRPVESTMMPPAHAPVTIQSRPTPPPTGPLAPKPESVRPGVTPPPPEPSPVHSDMGPPSLGLMPAGTRDSFSDTGSITTIEVSEAKTQPVLRPQVVQVHRRSADFHPNAGGTQTPTQPLRGSPSSSNPHPNERPVAQQKAPAPFVLPSQQPDAHPEPSHQDGGDHALAPAPLFSGPNSPASNKSNVPSPKVNRFEPPAPAPKPQPAVDDKWAKKPAADYSGGDWGDEDDWDY
ncbi:hypothetical protein AK830_g8309 [Neonectria ditissima]|uniref:WW domain-containing protein n=1 Tax=Neonectria ditissima TaxID=78410 RepID=A0A0P7AUR0_9HYPO|nr:hypothetical protein AK830_g8309 [Neonectria ditissima]